MKQAKEVSLPTHPVFIRKEFYGLIFYNSLDKNYYFFDKEAEEVIEQILSGAALDAEGEAFKQELFESGLLSSQTNRICHLQEGHLSAPLRVFIDITRICNLRCAHCFTDSGAKSSEELSSEEIHSLLNQMREAGTFLLSIAGGEPFLRKDIFSLIAYAKSLHIDVSLTTNGTKVTPAIAQELNKLKLRTLTVSIDGTEATHDNLRGKGNFQRALEGVRLLKQYCESASIAIKTTINSTNIGQAEELVRLAEALHLSSIKFNPVRPFGRACDHPELLITCDQYVDFLQKAQKLTSLVEVGLPKTPLDEREYEFIPLGFGCTGGKETCNITAEGDFSACAFLGKPYIVGNLRSHSFLELWERTHTSVDYVGNETCQTCGHYAHCRGGCRNRALYAYGNRDAIDPLCVLKKAVPDQKLTKRTSPEATLFYDHKQGVYTSSPDPKLLDNKQYREVCTSRQMPFKLFFDPTYRCNSRCIHCYNAKEIPSGEELSLPAIRSLAVQMAELGIMQLSLAGGEPFLRKEWYEICSLFLRQDIDISITTNGILLNAQAVGLLRALPLRGLTISIDGISRERYHQVRGIDALGVVEENVAALRTLPLSLSMRYSVMVGSESPSEVLRYAVSQGFTSLKVNKTHLLGRFVNQRAHFMEEEAYEEWIEGMRRSAKEYPIEVELPREKYLNPSPLPCSAGKKTVYVSPRGDVHPCPFTDQFLWGNLAEAPLSALLERGASFSVDNPHCLRCPAMNKPHGMTKKSYHNL